MTRDTENAAGTSELPAEFGAPADRHHLSRPLAFEKVVAAASAPVTPHIHAWGEFLHVSRGINEVSLGGTRFLAPPNCALWIPAGIRHVHLSARDVIYCRLSIAPAFCAQLPSTVKAMAVSPLLKRMLERLESYSSLDYSSGELFRFLHVMLDLVAAAPTAETYLPWSVDQQLEPILSLLSAEPSDNRTLAEHARSSNIAERTLIRRCARDLKMPFAQWKQRLRVVKAISLLETNGTIENIASELGYSSASSFIAMFKKMVGKTPDNYRTPNA